MNTSASLTESISILPYSIIKLWRIHLNLRKHNSISRRYGLNDNMDSRIQSKHQTGISSVQHQIATCQQYFARCRDGYSIVDH